MALSSDSAVSDQIACRLNHLRPSQALRLVLLAALLALLIPEVGLVVGPVYLGAVIFLLGVLAAAVAGLLLLVLLNELPETLQGLWKEDVFALRQGSSARAEADLGQAYLAFVKRLQRYLNSRLSWAWGLFLASWLFISFPARYSISPMTLLEYMVRIRPWDYIAWVTVQLILAFAIGLLVWRMAVIAIMVARLGSAFDFKLRLQHPDHSGGLRPLGNLCLMNALILSVAAIYVAGYELVLLLYRHVSVLDSYMLWLESVLGLVFGLAVVVFALPLYAVHRGMLRQRAQLREPLYKLTARIDELSRTLLTEAQTGDADRLGKLRSEREMLARIYQAASDIPTWPFDRAIVRKFTIAQVIPLLSLIAPLVEPLRKVFS